MNIQDLLSGAVIDSISANAGTGKQETSRVLADALPQLVRAMADNASTEEGAHSLAKALDDHDSSDSLEAILGGVDAADGARILQKILGGSSDAMEDAVSRSSGISRGSVTAILDMAAPMLLAALGGEKKRTNSRDSDLSDLLLSVLGSSSGSKRRSSRNDTAGTLLSLAGSLLGGSGRRRKSSSAGDLLGGLADLLTDNDPPAKKKKSSRRSSGSRRR